MPDTTGDESSETFILGITMAGAVSAGAYTAGVLDVLIQALDRHNARYEEGRLHKWQNAFSGHPRHKVAVKAMSGASAGGVCIGLAVTDLINLFHPRGDDRRQLPDPEWKRALTPPKQGAPVYRYRAALKAMHGVWVENLDLMHSDGSGFLSTTDLVFDRPLRSALNTTHIDEVSNAAMADITWKIPATSSERLSFLTDQLDMFFTTTNLMGVPYSVGFKAANRHEVDNRDAHKMAHHSTVRHFRLNGFGAHDCDSPWLEAWRDDGIALNVTPNVRLDFGKSADFEDNPDTWAKFRHASIATGAFPVGFSPRLLHAQAIDFGVFDSDNPKAARARGGAWPVEYHPGDALEYAPKPFGGAIGPEDWAEKIPYISVDGGAANNEPFEFARFAIRRSWRAHVPEDDRDGRRFLLANPREAADAHRAVLMIDPFPEGPVLTVPDIRKVDEELGMIRNLFRLPATLINQARFKPSELQLATDEGVRSRFLIAPSRVDGDVQWQGADAIASGALGGFIGFFDRNFRSHDFQLGQHNCARFIAEHFVLDPDNEVLSLDPDTKDRMKAAMADTDDEGRPKGVCVIQPAFPADYQFEQPVWPLMSLERLDALYEDTKTRFRALGAKLIQQQDLGLISTQGVKVVWAALRTRIGRAIASIVISEMIARDQIEGFVPVSGPDPVRRSILSALAANGQERVSPSTLHKRISSKVEQETLIGDNDGLHRAPDLGQIEALLDRLSQREAGAEALVWRAAGKKDGEHQYLLRHFKPSLIGRGTDSARGLVQRLWPF